MDYYMDERLHIKFNIYGLSQKTVHVSSTFSQ